MYIIKGDLWKKHSTVKVVPTNASLKLDGSAVMGAGVAKQAADLWTSLPSNLGWCLRTNGNRLYIFQVPDHLWTVMRCSAIVTFPTKVDWRSPAQLDLVEQSLKELSFAQKQNYSWQSVLLPEIGMGLGKLPKPDVYRLCMKYLNEDFTMVQYEKED